MLMPKRVKHRKQHRGRMRGLATRGNMIDFGDFGIMALEPCWVTSRAVLGDQSTDRSGPYRDDPTHQAWRSGLDSHLPG